MHFLNPKARIALGLVGIMSSLVMLCFSFNIIPDRSAAVRDGRAALAESIAIYSTALVKTVNYQGANIQRLSNDFKLLVERNDDLLSLALRRENGRVLVATAEHSGLWQTMTGEYSHASQVRVPIWSGKQKWGQLEMHFQSLTAPGIIGWLKSPMVLTVLFLGLIGFLIYYFYLGKVLRQLDPSQAIPGRVRTALDTMAEGLLILDRKEQIVLANQAFSSMVERTPTSLMGVRAGELPWLDKTGKKIIKSARPWVIALSSGETQRDYMIRLQLSKGEYRTFKLNCSPVLGEGGKPAGVLVSFDDVTELEEKEAELISSKLEAEEANRAKSSFLANMSHEIRTPMNAILGFTDILKRGYIKNEQESLKYLNTIHSSGKNLLELINDILDLSKVESGHLEIEKLQVEPYPIIAEVIQVLQAKANEKDLRLEFEINGAMPETIEVDPVRLRQIILNLVGNSIKFTESGEVVVSCQFEENNGAPQLLINVKDTGIGMSETALIAIFDPFVQADNTVSRRFGGTGLGLAISLKFVEAMGGNIKVKSRPGEGSLFTVVLPTGDLSGVKFLQPEELEIHREPLETTQNFSWKFPAARVLVVDDGTENRELVRLLLEDAGLDVDEAENGQQGVEKVQSISYAAVLMDVNMPVMDGFTATGLLRKQGFTMPIIALTANAMKGYEDECLAVGYSGYLSKPIDIDEFMALMAQLLQGEKIVGETSSTPVSSGPKQLQVEPASLDTSPIISKLPADNEKFQKIVQRFVSRLGEQLDVLDAALSRQDYAEVFSLAHWLKGAAGTVGFDPFTEPAAQLEGHAKEQDQVAAEISVAKLRSLAARIVTGPTAAQPPPSPPLSVVPPPDRVNLVTSQPLVSRLAGNARLHRIILRFIDSLEEKNQMMQNAIVTGDLDELASLAHWLKGAGGTVGYDDFTEPAGELENYAKTGQLDNAKEMVVRLTALIQNIVPPEEPVEEQQAVRK